ncbi:AAA family ATPase [Streptomyces sp. NPDC002324]
MQEAARAVPCRRPQSQICRFPSDWEDSVRVAADRAEKEEWALVPEWDETATRLIGRGEELARLDAVIGGLGRDGVPSVIDIAADAGMGKSRLLSELCARARRRGLTVLCGRATEYERHTPFQPFTDAFADADPAFLLSDAVPDAAAPALYGVRDSAARMHGRDRFGLYRAVDVRLVTPEFRRAAVGRGASGRFRDILWPAWFPDAPRARVHAHALATLVVITSVCAAFKGFYWADDPQVSQ